jgi:hypothetical protein
MAKLMGWSTLLTWAMTPLTWGHDVVDLVMTS